MTTTNAFNIGDRVQVLSNAPDQFHHRQGEVIELDDSPTGGIWPVGIKFSDEGKTYWFDGNELKLVVATQGETT